MYLYLPSTLVNCLYNFNQPKTTQLTFSQVLSQTIHKNIAKKWLKVTYVYQREVRTISLSGYQKIIDRGFARVRN